MTLDQWTSFGHNFNIQLNAFLSCANFLSLLIFLFRIVFACIAEGSSTKECAFELVRFEFLKNLCTLLKFILTIFHLR